MELTPVPYERMAPLLPKRFGYGHTIDKRTNRWSKNGVPDCVFEPL